MTKTLFRSEALERRYEILSLLGRGGMAEVYLARDTELKRPVAIKVRTATDEQDPDMQPETRFREEGRVMDLLKHPSIVRLYSAGRDGDRDYLVFEYVEGETLSQLLGREKRLPLDRTVTFLSDILRGLQHAHGAGIVHRDLKPGNVMIRSPQGTAHIMDFGVARRDSGRSFQTRAGVIIGTPAYMAREQIRERAITPAIDLYAAGAIAYECVAGAPPFVAPTDGELFRLLLSDVPAPDLQQIVPDFLGAISRVIARALEKDPARRPATAGEMLEDLQRAATLAGLDAGASRELDPADRPSRPAPSRPAASRSVSRGLLSAPTSRGTTSRTQARVPPRAGLAAAALAGVALLATLSFLFSRPTATRQVTAAGRVALVPGPSSVRLVLLEPRLENARLTAPLEKPFDARGEVELSVAYDEDGISLQVAGEDADGPVVVYDLPVVRGLVARFLEEAERFDPAPLFHQLVEDPAFVRGESYEDHRKAAEPGLHFTSLIRKYVEKNPAFQNLDALRGIASDFFGDPSVHTDTKRRVLTALYRLHSLDLFLIFQRDRPLLEIPPIHSAFLRVSHHTEPPVIDPGTVHVIRSPTCWKTEDNNDDFSIVIFNQVLPVTAHILEDPYPGPGAKVENRSRRPAARDYLPVRTFPVELPGEPRASRIRVRTVLAFCGPAYYYEVRFLDSKGLEVLRLPLTHSGEIDWYQAMDGALGAPLKVVEGVTTPHVVDLDQARLSWCEVRWELPASLLPPGPYKVRISYHHLPGPSIKHWGKHQRLSYIQRMALEYLKP